MADAITTATQDIYTDLCTFPIDIDTRSIVFDIGNQPVLMQVMRFLDGRREAYLDPTELTIIPSLGNVLTNIAGARWRSAIAGQSAVLIAKRFTTADANLSPGVAYDGLVSSSGGLTPGGSALPLSFQHNGAAVATESAADFEDGAAATPFAPQLLWNVTDDPANGRVKITPSVVQATRLLDHKIITAPVTFTATSEGTANSVILGNSVTVDGVHPVLIEFYCARIESSAAGAETIVVVLKRGATVIVGKWANLFTQSTAAANTLSLYLGFQETPAAGSYQYQVLVYSTSASGGVVQAQAAGTGNNAPAFLRVSYDV